MSRPHRAWQLGWMKLCEYWDLVAGIDEHSNILSVWRFSMFLHIVCMLFYILQTNWRRNTFFAMQQITKDENKSGCGRCGLWKMESIKLLVVSLFYPATRWCFSLISLEEIPLEQIPLLHLAPSCSQQPDGRGFEFGSTKTSCWSDGVDKTGPNVGWLAVHAVRRLRSESYQGEVCSLSFIKLQDIRIHLLTG